MKFERRLVVSVGPHVRSEDDTRSIMLDVIIALIFPLIIAIYFFGFRSLTLTLVSVSSAIAFEWLYRYFTKKPPTIGDLSAVVTGMIFAFCMPVTTPLWMIVICNLFAIVIVKQLYGGIGKNFMNPAAAARIFAFSWPALVTIWTKPLSDFAMPLFGNVDPSKLPVDVISSATPLAKMKVGNLPSVVEKISSGEISATLRDVFLGNVPGCIGEVSAVVILASFVYLLIRRVILPHVPLAYIGTVAILTFLFPKNGNNPLEWMLFSIFSGGLMFGAVFMATDYATSPVSKGGKILFGIGCGALTVLIRYFGAYSEGVAFSIIIMNSLTWALDKYVKPTRFGVDRFAFLKNILHKKAAAPAEGQKGAVKE